MTDNKPAIFKKIKSILMGFESSTLIGRGNDTKYEMYGTKKVFMFGREINGMYFAAAMIQKGFVGFYYFPIYVETKHNSEIPENLKKLLKGKTCFHIKKDDAEIYKSIKALLKKGKAFYKKQGWI